MKVNFYNYSKRKNSTSTPTGTGTEKDVVLKENTSVHDPVLIMSGGVNVSWNYAYIATFERYYFVRDIVSVKAGVSEYYLTEDVMASHKTEIGATKARIAFSTSYIDTMIPDTRLGVKNSKQVNTSLGSANILDTTGCYILTVFNGIPSSGMGCSYMLKENDLQAIAFWFANEYNNLSTQFFNGSAIDGIFSLIWVPFQYSATAGVAPTHIYIGDRSMTAPSGARQLDNRFSSHYTDSLSCNLRYTDFRKVEPYTTGNLFLPGIGTVDLNMSDFVNASSISIEVHREYLTGDLFYSVSNGEPFMQQCVVATYTTNVASTCPLGQIMTNANGAVGSLTSMGGGVVAGIGALAAGSPIGVAAAAGALIGSAASFALQANKRQVSISGNVGGRGWETLPGNSGFNSSGKILHTEISVDTEDPTDSDYQALRGGPVCKTDTIGNYLGYIQCEGASVLCSGSEQEREEINAMLNSGFYYA